MPQSKNFTTTPFHGRSNGGTNLRNIHKGSIVYGTKGASWFFKMPVALTELGFEADLTAITPGDVIYGTGFATGGKAWTTVFPGTPCSLCIDTHTTTANTQIVVRLSGYDQFDRLVEEEISCAAADRHALSRAAYSEAIQLELVSKGSIEVTDLDVSILGTADHSGFSIGLAGAANACTYIGLPFIPDRYGLCQASINAENTASGYLRNLNTKNADGVGLWSMQNQSASVADSVLMLDTDVMNLGAGTLLLPGFSAADDSQVGVVHFDPVVAKETL